MALKAVFILGLIVGSLVVVRASIRTSSWDTLPLMASRPPPPSSCDSVCNDLPKFDTEPVCMMYSRYKKGYIFFVNLCHARKAICKENLFLHVVHSQRCIISNQHFLPYV